MSKLTSFIRKRAAHNGIELRGIARARRAYRIFGANRRAFLEMLGGSKAGDAFPLARDYPCLYDRDDTSGVANGHYFHQDLHVAQRVRALSPRRHIDVGSRVDGFVAHVATFREIEVIDIRELRSEVPNIIFRQGDLMQPLPEEIGTADSVSCLHTLEHMGLGRYGDRIDPDGHLLALANLSAIVEPGGRLYLSVPMGTQRIEFDAHRVFALPTLLGMVEPDFEVAAFSYVDDNGSFTASADPKSPEAAQSFGFHYGCAILELIKRSS